MEEGPDPKGKKANQPFSWLPQIDQVLVVGMKYGPKETHDAFVLYRELVTELSHADLDNKFTDGNRSNMPQPSSHG